MSRTIGTQREDSVLLTDGAAAEPRKAAQRGGERVRDQRRGLKGLLFGLAVLALLAVLRMSAPQSVAAGMSDSAKDFVTLAVSVLIESLPFVFLGIFLSVVVQVWLPDGFLLRHLPRRGVLRRFAVSLIGVLVPVCECGNVPLTRGLIMKGLTVAEAMTFLLAAPILNPITIITTYQAFGWENGILVSRIAGGFLIANLIGWIYSRHPRQEALLTSQFQAACASKGEHHAAAGKLQRSVRLFTKETSAMMPALFIGCAIAGAIQVGIPRDVLVTLGTNPVWSVLALMALAFVVSICSNVDAFFVLSFGATFLPGAIVAFLVFGPMIDIKMLVLMRTTFTARTLVQITSVVALCSAALGLAVNYVA
ncbi:permease [Cryobacterium sp. Y29]|uniref:permease n=1 Tax=Cryobacterium sp. Y29 TaxID=2048285 RepID=UPI000CE2BBAC|nr:permease [Cryobacterium sp. Y29]